MSEDIWCKVTCWNTALTGLSECSWIPSSVLNLHDEYQEKTNSQQNTSPPSNDLHLQDDKMGINRSFSVSDVVKEEDVSTVSDFTSVNNISDAVLVTPITSYEHKEKPSNPVYQEISVHEVEEKSLNSIHKERVILTIV